MPDNRLSPLDAAFLHLEDHSAAHMHVAAVLVFEGPAPAYEDLLVAVERRLPLVPRYRQRLHHAPLGLTTPAWVDDPHFRLDYHVRQAALPRPGTQEQLEVLAGRVFSQRLDRNRPLWEMWLVEGLEGGRFALCGKTHHCLVDGISGIDIATVLFDTERTPHDAGTPPQEWHGRPLPSMVRTAVDAAVDAALRPATVLRGAANLLGEPQRLAGAVRTAAGGLAALATTVATPAPRSPYNAAPIGSHRRFTWVRVPLADVKAIKNACGATVNDVVLAAVAGALRRHLLRRGHDVEGLELTAMVPVSVRTDLERGALGNRVATMLAPLPVGVPDALARLHTVTAAMRGLKESGQAVGAQVLTQIAGLGPPTIVAQAARLLASPRTFNLTVTNVPGPQLPLYVLGRELLECVPMVPLAADHALGVAIISYNGALFFGLVGDYDLLADLHDVAGDLADALEELATDASVPQTPGGRRSRPARARSAPAPSGAEEGW